MLIFAGLDILNKRCLYEDFILVEFCIFCEILLSKNIFYTIVTAYNFGLLLADCFNVYEKEPYKAALEKCKIFFKLCKPTQLTCTCSKSPIETLEKGVNYVQS